MTVLPNILLVAGAATLLALWCGWGLARLTLPPSLQPWSGLLAPLMGYALVLVVGYWGVRDLVGIGWALAILLPVTGVLNVVAWVRTDRPKISNFKFQISSIFVHLPLTALLGVTFLVGVAPIINYDHPAIIGANWDVENYLPLTRYLERGPASAIASAPPNPLRDLNAHPPAIGLTLGFSTWQASVDTLTGQEAITTFAILLSWLRMLGIIGVYVLFRSILGMKRWFALLGAAFVSAGGLLLWVEYFNFGMQIAAWPLIPLGLTLGIAAVEDAAERGVKSWPVVVGGAITLAALPVAYYPALTLFAPLAAGLGIAALVKSKRRATLLLGAAALAVVTLILSVPAVIDYFQGFSFRYGQQLTSLGLFRYVPLTDFGGLTPFSLRNDPPVPALAVAAFILLAALMLIGLGWDRRRIYWAGITLGGAGYMLWLWSQQYPYAWMKGGAYAAFPFLGLAAAGIQAIAVGRRTTDDGRRTTVDERQIANEEADYSPKSKAQSPKLQRTLLAGVVGLAILVLMGLGEVQIVADNWQTPGLYAKELPEILSLRGVIPNGSSVTLTSDPRINGVTTALAAYMLDKDIVLGDASTGYVPSWSNGGPGEIGDYALLLSGEDPEAQGFTGGPVWQGAGFSLYKRDPGTLAHLSLDHTLVPGETLEISVGEKQIGSEITSNDNGARRGTTLAIAAFVPGKLDLEGTPASSGGSTTVDIPSGGSTVILGAFETPQKLLLRNSGTSPLVIRWARLTMPGDVSQTKVDPDSKVVLSQARAQSNGDIITTAISTLSPNTGPLTLALDIWDHKRSAHYGWYGVEQPLTKATTTFTLTLALDHGIMTGINTKGEPLSIGGGLDTLQRGDYTASLNVLAGTQLLTAPVETFDFSVDTDGNISAVKTLASPIVAVKADTPAVPLSVSGPANDVQLTGYTLGDETAHPGGQVSITLWWHSLANNLDERSILLHLQDPKGDKRAQADGPPANGGRPTTTWQGGETIIDQHAIKIPADLPPGRYNLAVGMYHYPSLDPVPLTQKDPQKGIAKPLEGNVLLIPLEVKP